MSWNYDALPEHWKKYYLKFADRGWFDLETGKWIEEKKEKNTTLPLPISIEDSTTLSAYLLQLGILDKSPQISAVFFELIRRVTNGSLHVIDFPNNDEVKKLWDIGQSQNCEIPEFTSDNQDSFDERIKVDLSNHAHPYSKLPITQEDYTKLAKLLGNLAIEDNKNNDNKDHYDKMQSLLFPKLFLYLNSRAKNGNHFEFDDELLELETNVKAIMSAERIK